MHSPVEGVSGDDGPVVKGGEAHGLPLGERA